MSTIKKIYRAVVGGPWEPRKCLWPYPEGYATYNRETKTALDFRLTKERAQEICDEMNKAELEPKEP